MEEYIQSVRAGLENSYREVDRLLVTVSSGVLAFTVAFPKSNIKVHSHPMFLYLAWGTYLFTIILVLFSLISEQKSKIFLIKNDGRVNAKWNRGQKFIYIMNKMGIQSFMLATLFLFLFLITSINL